MSIKHKLKEVAEKMQNHFRPSTGNKAIFQLLYVILSNPIIQAVLQLAIPIIITISWEKFYGSNKKYFVIICIISSLIIGLFAWINHYNKQKSLGIEWFMLSLNKISTENCAQALAFHNCLAKYNKFTKYNDRKQNCSSILEECGVQTAALTISRNIVSMMDKMTEMSQINSVFIFQRKRESFKCIAFNPLTTILTGDYTDIGKTTEIHIESDLYCSRIFAENNPKIRVLLNEQEIKEKLGKYNMARNELNIKQCILIPIGYMGDSIDFLVQIDTTCEYLFGNTKQSVKEFARNVFMSHAYSLQLAGEMQSTLEKICNID